MIQRDRISPFLKNPLLRWVWARVREQRIIYEHQQVADFWRRMITLYSENGVEKVELKTKKELPNEKVIWQYWGQGLSEEVLPDVVKICFESVDKYKGPYQVIRLTDDTIAEYLDLPEFVLDKRQNPQFKTVFFSDLLRLALLKVYGGVWLDATVLLSGEIPIEYSDGDYFVFQRDVQAKDKKGWINSYAYYWNWHPKFKVNVLNSIFFAKKDSVAVSCLLCLMFYYWKTQEKVINYFFFQILYDVVMEEYLSLYKCKVIDDTYPHLLQSKINGRNIDYSYEEILEAYPMHKLTYFTAEGIAKLHRIKNIL